MSVLSKLALSSTASDQFDHPQRLRLFYEFLACSHGREKRLLGPSCSSLYPHVSVQLTLQVFMRKFILETFMIICPENSNFVEIGTNKYVGQFTRRPELYLIVIKVLSLIEILSSCYDSWEVQLLREREYMLTASLILGFLSYSMGMHS
jgi:hypothetical protein